MFGKRVSWLAAACLAAAVLAGGCGDDEGGGAALDVTGHWKSTVTAPGIYMHGPMCLEQTGNAVSGIVAKQVVTGSVAGDTLHMTSGDTGSGDYWTGTATVVAAGRLEGTFEQYVSGALVVSGIVELERYTPR